ncbi:2-C-methyl-D-erythritol 2,4-cyclodiphosphate synthase [Acinetobacter sp. ANC 3832]|uniref:2-C-methyl-D-erythritol 2,4-cyclodiphosphate synthase n=1 Tax=Acinetobacter sp. ANC 3832 TaxID=1977874 RepID=UPI000A332BD8|nr:2-C-methyl-D-erythritol 2,4-cyclodiphosphate synthase [Acinetobacter sp. ANC 3832]OTG87806.1 2-C-methyl-D-erythritol 2,4-cyclodiphosphate synthase [Acinetobacter sp. ANC 3832]
MIAQIRIGQGMDVHAFEEGDFVTLAGVKIPHSHGLKAHSDGDVVLHALCDALLGALALGDIGQHFPDTDPDFKGADSRELLKHVYQLILDRGYALNNADITVACERPKLAKHNLEMRQSIADVLDVDVTQISVKATTTEKLGFTGRQEGILSMATVLIAHRPSK